MTEPGSIQYVERKVGELDVRFSAHEAVCAERYFGLERRLGRIEKILLSIAGLMIVSMAGALWRSIGGP